MVITKLSLIDMNEAIISSSEGRTADSELNHHILSNRIRKSAMQLGNLFDRLPDELASRVFTAGCDLFVRWDYGRLAVQRQEYPFNTAMRRSCQAFLPNFRGTW